MAKIAELFRNRAGFTLVEVSIASAMMLSMISIFSLFPAYKAQLSVVTIKEKANSIAQEAITQIENGKVDENPQVRFLDVDLNGASYIVDIISSPQNQGPYEIVREYSSGKNITFNAYIESYNIDTLNINNTQIGNEAATWDGSNVSKVNVAVAWQGPQCGNHSKEHVINNTSITYNSASRVTSAAVCSGGQAGRDRCFCAAEAASCSKSSCRCKTD